MAKKGLSQESLKRIIFETAVLNKKKEELWGKAVEIVNELNTLEESHRGMVGSHGFATPGDNINKTKTGFENEFYVSRLSELGAEIQAAHEAEIAKEQEAAQVNEDLMDTVSELKQQIEDMKKEQESLKESIQKKKKKTLNGKKA